MREFHLSLAISQQMNYEAQSKTYSVLENKHPKQHDTMAFDPHACGTVTFSRACLWAIWHWNRADTDSSVSLLILAGR